VLVRAALRRLLAELLDVAPADVVLRSDGGRPVPDGTGLQVSCSASADLALLTVADRAVGIDVQVHRDDEARDAVAEGWLAPAELAVIAALPARERPLAVTRAWTQKEAVLKARGTGVRRLPVDVVTPGAARGFVGALHLAPVPVPPGYVASIATGAPAVLNLPDPAPLTPGGAR
jgi:4'-phosphopantetheinyl transferase